MKTFYTADMHFGHNKLAELGYREYGFDPIIVDNWNNVVNDEDQVFILGDVSFYKRDTTCSILKQLKGRKILIKGNHDSIKECNHWVNEGLIEEWHHYLERKLGKKTIVLSHYPFQVWNKSHYGSFHLHGHSHGSLPRINRRIDVGVDNNNLQLFEEVSLIESLKLEEIHEFEDHHKPQRKAKPGPVEHFEPKTELAKALWKIRKEIVASGTKLLTRDEIRKQIQEGR